MVRLIGGSESDPNRVADRPDIQKGKRRHMSRPIEKGMIVRIKDMDEAGIWRGLTGEVTRVHGPNINVRTWEGTARLTAAELEPSPQLPLYLP